MLQQQLSQILHDLHTQPSSRTFWLMALYVNFINSEHMDLLLTGEDKSQVK
jgi:hypothetical protein